MIKKNMSQFKLENKKNSFPFKWKNYKFINENENLKLIEDNTNYSKYKFLECYTFDTIESKNDYKKIILNKNLNRTYKQFTIIYNFTNNIILTENLSIMFYNVNFNEEKNINFIKSVMIEKISFYNRNLIFKIDEKLISDYRLLTMVNYDIKELLYDQDLLNLETNTSLFMI